MNELEDNTKDTYGGIRYNHDFIYIPSTVIYILYIFLYKQCPKYCPPTPLKAFYKGLLRQGPYNSRLFS